MKVFSSTTDFNYSWDEVSTANWQKYSPWNEKAQHVIAVDTISRTVDPDTGILRTERLITCKQSAPKWVTSIIPLPETSIVHETSYIDPASRKLTMCSTNLSFSDYLSVRETVQYTPHPTLGDAKTRFLQRAEITAFCGGWQKIKNKIEAVTCERFGENAAVGREGFEMVLRKAREVFAEERQKVAMEQAVREGLQA